MDGRQVTDPLRVDELNLFPGTVAAALALLGVLRGQGRVRFAYLAGLALAVEMTRGTSSFVYLWLFEHVRGVPGAAISCAYRHSRESVAGRPERVRRRVPARQDRTLHVEAPGGRALAALLIIEYASAPVITPAPVASRIDKLLSTRPAAIIVELPLTSPRGIWGSLDWLYMYQGMNHFQRMLNGYSGRAPAALYQLRDAMASFPDDRSLTYLRDRRVDYVVVRAGLYEPEARALVLEQMNGRSDLSLEAMWMEGPQGAEAIYALEK